MQIKFSTMFFWLFSMAGSTVSRRFHCDACGKRQPTSGQKTGVLEDNVQCHRTQGLHASRCLTKKWCTSRMRSCTKRKSQNHGPPQRSHLGNISQSISHPSIPTPLNSTCISQKLGHRKTHCEPQAWAGETWCVGYVGASDR